MITIFSSATIHGDGRGSKIGFPTINLVHTPEIPSGVYACLAQIDGNSECLAAVLHIGDRPTFHAGHSCEIHIISKIIAEFPSVCTVQVIQFIRPTCSFANTEELQKQIAVDIHTATLLLHEKIS